MQRKKKKRVVSKTRVSINTSKNSIANGMATTQTDEDYQVTDNFERTVPEIQ